MRDVSPLRTHLESVDSTNREVARRYANDPSMASWTVVTADHQTEGRGRYGRTWLDSPHALLASVFVRVPDDTLTWGTALSGLSLAEALEDVYADQNVEIQLKWPNDMIFRGRKVGGILAEHLGTETRVVQARASLISAEVSTAPGGALSGKSAALSGQIGVLARQSGALTRQSGALTTQTGALAKQGGAIPGQTLHALVIGFGLNFSKVHPAAGRDAGYLPHHHVTPEQADTIVQVTEPAQSETAEVHKAILNHFVQNLDEHMSKGDVTQWRASYRRRLIGLGQETSIRLVDGQVTQAEVVDIDDHAGIVVRTEQGTQTITCADVDLPNFTGTYADVDLPNFTEQTVKQVAQ